LKKINWKIPLYKVSNDSSEIKAISKVIKRGMDWAIGPEIEEFENKLAKYIGTKYCISFNSGTSAGHAALLSYNLKKNDQVLVPSFSFIATANWPLMANCETKFVDIEEQNYGMDPKKIENSISKKTKIIMPIHYAGLPCKINEIKKIAKQNKIVLIEDAAESIGSKINKQNIGTFGELGIFSFAGNKILTSGEGGAIVTNSKEKFDKLKLIRSHGRKSVDNYFSSIQTPKYVELGYNWRMSSITAAICLSQLDKIEKLINSRRQNAKYYQKKLKKFKEIKIHEEPIGYKHVYQLYSIQLPSKKIRDGLSKFLAKKGIMSKVFFAPIHLTDHFSSYKIKQKKMTNTEKISERILSLPMYPDLRKDEINEIVDTISEFFEQK
tara:strand:- start:7034 stop:8176 length:1143 start_codon:yes stop_codon:yes gene_type:complete